MSISVCMCVRLLVYVHTQICEYVSVCLSVRTLWVCEHMVWEYLCGIVWVSRCECRTCEWRCLWFCMSVRASVWEYGTCEWRSVYEEGMWSCVRVCECISEGVYRHVSGHVWASEHVHGYVTEWALWGHEWGCVWVSGRQYVRMSKTHTSTHQS